MTWGHRTALIAVLCLFSLCLLNASKPQKKNQKKDERIYLEHADTLFYDAYGPHPDAQIVKGNVAFTHQGARLTCDSAYFYRERNSFRAFSRVKFVQGDTLTLTCDRSFYNGMNQVLEAAGDEVRLVHRRQVLTTDSMRYYRLDQNAYYYDGGKLVEGNDQLVSDWGTYNTGTKKAKFCYDVVLLSDGQRVTTDTLYYDTNTSLAHAVGPTHVVSDSTIIDTNDGYFSSKEDRAELFGRSTVVNGTNEITGDSLYYDKATGFNQAFGNVIYVDRKNLSELYGDYIEYNEQTGHGYATKRAMVKEYSQGDTLYVHGDTLRIETFNIDTDSIYRLIHGYNKVRAYRIDVQAMCDSLVVDSRDSCMTMYKDPVVWNGNRQILGEIIKVYSNDSTIREANIIGQALSIEKCDDDNHWNQISAKRMDTYFVEGAMRRMTASGNVKVIYYPVDDQDSTLMLLNYTTTDSLRLFLSADRQMEKIWTSKHESVGFPMTQIPAEMYRLPEFAWFEEQRPRDKDDIWEWRGKGEGAELKENNRQSAPRRRLTKPEEPVVIEQPEDGEPASDAATPDNEGQDAIQQEQISEDTDE